ncbi:MAG: sugar phosphate isomerase/epimerase [Caldilineaceae bacterium]
MELTNLYWTCAGIYPGGVEISRFGFRDRVEAAAAAGFTGIGIWHADLEHTLGGMSLAEMRAILAGNGIHNVELEFLTDWFVGGERKAASDARKRLLLGAAEALAGLGRVHLKVGDFDRTPAPFEQIVESYRVLCDEAADYGALVAFEFMASAMIGNLREARALVEQAGAPNGGLAIDIAHVVDCGVEYAEIRELPGQYIVSVELNDGLQRGSVGYNPGARRFCGEGEFDIAGFVQAVRAAGYRGPWAVEVFAPGLAGLGLAELNRLAYGPTVAQLARTVE